MIEIAAQGGDHPHVATPGQGIDGPDKTLALARQTIHGEKFLNLINHQHAEPARLSLNFQSKLGLTGSLRKHTLNQHSDSIGRLAEHLRCLMQAGAIAAQFRQSVLVPESKRESIKQIAFS